MAAVAGALAVASFRNLPAPPGPVTFQIPPPPAQVFQGSMAVAPDGQSVGFVARGEDGVSSVWVRKMDALEARPVAGTDGATSVFWSPDARSVGFVVGRVMRRVRPGSSRRPAAWWRTAPAPGPPEGPRRN